MRVTLASSQDQGAMDENGLSIIVHQSDRQRAFSSWLEAGEAAGWMGYDDIDDPFHITRRSIRP